MAGKKDGSAPWRQTSVVIRADIFDEASHSKIDISEVCNRALAERLGIDFGQQKIPEGNIPVPVIIAPNVVPALPVPIPAKPGEPSANAIINADDPHAAKALKSQRLTTEKPARNVPAPPAAPVMATETIPRQAPPATEKTKKACLRRKKKDDSAKEFFAAMILREDAGDALVVKDDMYYAFERWCRNHSILVIPDKKSFSVTLKNQFAVKEKMMNGTPTWVGVRLKK